MPRLFTGLEIPRTVADRLMLLRGEIPGARWLSPNNYHITLRFLGDVSDAVADEFVARIERLNIAPFELQLHGVGYFGSRRPTNLWAAVAPCEELMELAHAHERAAAMVGLEPERRPYTPHITLARLSRTRAREIAPFMNNFASYRSEIFPVTEAALFSAKPSVGGGPYVIEQTFPFLATE